MEGLHGHFLEQRVETHMYSSQWFLTIYTAKFPIAMVFRILDVYLCEVRERLEWPFFIICALIVFVVHTNRYTYMYMYIHV